MAAWYIWTKLKHVNIMMLRIVSKVSLKKLFVVSVARTNLMFYFLDFHYQGRQVFFISSKVTVTFIEIISLSDAADMMKFILHLVMLRPWQIKITNLYDLQILKKGEKTLQRRYVIRSGGGRKNKFNIYIKFSAQMMA